MPGTRTVSPSAWKAGDPRCGRRARPGRPRRTRRGPAQRRQPAGSRGRVRGRVARLPSAARARPPRHAERRRRSRGRPGVAWAAGGHPADRRAPLSACGCWDPRTRTRSPPGREWHAPRPPQAASRPPSCSARPCGTPIRSPRHPHRTALVECGEAIGMTLLEGWLPRPSDSPETRRTEATACRALLPI
jgi:hypothetical protein